MKVSKFAEATSIAVAGNLNKILSILISTYVFEEAITTHQIFGLLISLIGVALYVIKDVKKLNFNVRDMYYQYSCLKLLFFH